MRAVLLVPLAGVREGTEVIEPTDGPAFPRRTFALTWKRALA